MDGLSSAFFSSPYTHCPVFSQRLNKSICTMHLTVLKRPLVKFSDVHGGYLEGATLTFKVEYEPELEVTSQDWVAIIPAGSNDLRQFVSFQIAPMHNENCHRLFEIDRNGNESNSPKRPHTHSICFDPQFSPVRQAEQPITVPVDFYFQIIFIMARVAQTVSVDHLGAPSKGTFASGSLGPSSFPFYSIQNMLKCVGRYETAFNWPIA
ncbi:hypothetical protein Tcan_12949 [Toxocara canis]|uniref:Uncharacterized protein n=1 Tax=Toxocara canis TaxID=6265 RepID=A0A0B2VLY4_TOXCA|nr:hypothetical protein Tcan_12949 [Toxocara canis]